MEATFNPTYGSLNIISGDIIKFTLKIFDSNGKIARKICKVMMKGVHQLDLNFSEWAQGTYVLNAFIEDNFFKSFKVVKE